LADKSEITVTELAAALAISQPLVSWHLRNLRRVGLVRTRRQGREVYCSLDRSRFMACQEALEQVVAPPTPARAGATPPPDRPMPQGSINLGTGQSNAPPTALPAQPATRAGLPSG
jgi:hypothetical protein